jgi:hypothetical protein
MLRLYDVGVLGFSCRYIWGCPSSLLLTQYDACAGESHLDVGVGTGYFLDRCRFPTLTPRIELVDLNANTLDHTGLRIARYAPRRHVRNVLEPLRLDVDQVESAGINFLLHCVPGTMSEKAVVFDHVAEYVKPGGTVFGSTILAKLDGQRLPTRRARQLMRLYCNKGIFSNSADDFDTLERELEARFSNVEVDVMGAVALFRAKVRPSQN